VRVVQISDTHLSADTGVPAAVRALVDWIRADPPDLVVHTGDVVWQDPDNSLDREFARLVLNDLPCRLVTVPGNHDVGFFEAERLPVRLTAFRATWGPDRFVVDGDGWRLVGIDVYTIGDGEADAWATSAMECDGPIALFLHQPLCGEPHDGWQLPDHVATCLDRLVAAADVRVIASGHRHCRVVRTDEGAATHVWAPSTTLVGTDRYHDGDPSPGAVEYRFEPGGEWSHRFIDTM
jgi:3',5'-cyclic AMP phosphodiesterase CpdA